MQPTNQPIDLNQLRAVWEHFTARGQLPTDVETDPLVSSSWQRCAPRLNPTLPPQWAQASDATLLAILNQNIALRTIARPIMEDIHQFIEGADAMLLLTDSVGCVLELLGDSAIVQYVSCLGLRRGVFLSEGHIGTTAFAVALIEATPAQVIGAEHFLGCLHELSTAAAPIHNLEGVPIGAIGLIETIVRRSPQSLGIVVAAAKAIENELQAELAVRQANTEASKLHATLDAISEGVLAWSVQGIIVHLNDTAGQLLELKPNVVAGRPLTEFITLSDTLAQAVAHGQELNDAETVLMVTGQPRNCLVSLRIIRGLEHEPITYIATLKPIAQVHQLVSRLVGAQARLKLDDTVGYGVAARRVRKQALTAATADACALIVGEMGTGRNSLARAIHTSGPRANEPFLAINCRAIPRALAVGELLGFEAGAFNAPSAGQPSKFELANGGTLFLDEIEALSLEAQAALLSVIEMRDIIRLGGARVIPVNVRVIASTTRQLDQLVAEGAFRSDLLLRLSSFVINTVPLRERPEDIPLLIDRLVEHLSAQLRHQLVITPAARAVLATYPWPGNIRELESVLERAAVLCEDQPIQPLHLPAELRQRRSVTRGKPISEPVRSLEEAEQLAIMAAGRAARGNLTQTAQFLGMGRTTLWRKMKALGITPDDFLK